MEESPPRGMIDILQELYGDSWRTPSMLKNKKIQEELSARGKSNTQNKSKTKKLTERSTKNIPTRTSSEESNYSSETSNKLQKYSYQTIDRTTNKKSHDKKQKSSMFQHIEDDSSDEGTSSKAISDEIISNSSENEYQSLRKNVSSEKSDTDISHTENKKNLHSINISDSEPEETFILKRKNNFNRIISSSSDEDSHNLIDKNRKNKINTTNESDDKKAIASSSNSEINENSVICISESDSDDANSLEHPTLDLSIIPSNYQSIQFDQNTKRKTSNSSDSDQFKSNDNVVSRVLKNNNNTPKPSSRVFTPKKTMDDSFINDNESTSSGDNFANTPAFYNRLDNIIKKSNVKKSSKKRVKTKLNTYSDSDSDDDGNIMSVTICDIESNGIDNITDGFDDFKISKEVNRDVAKKLDFEHTPNSTKKTKVYSDIYSKNKLTLSFLASLSENVDIKNCHKDAIPFIQNFKKRREDLTRTLFELFNREVFDNKFDKDFQIVWCNSLRTTAGFCEPKRHYKDGVMYYKSSVRLSVKVCDRPCRARDTLIHELCHAANFDIDQIRGAKHGLKWKYWTRKAERLFPELPHISVTHNYQIEYNFVFECDTCHHRIFRHKNSVNANTYCLCGFASYTGFRRQADGTYKQIEASTRAPSAFSKFVKENYATVKSTFNNHKDRMKELSNLYAKQKKTEV